MMDNDRRGRLLGIELKFFSQFYTYTSRFQQLKQLSLLLKVWTCRITKTKTRSLVLLTKQLPYLIGIFAGNPQLLPNPLVPQFRQRFGPFNAEPVEIKIFSVV